MNKFKDEDFYEQRMAEILELYTEFKNHAYDDHLRRVKYTGDMGSTYALSHEQASHIEDYIEFSNGDAEADSIINIFFTDATLRNQPKIYRTLYDKTLKCIQYVYDNLIDFHLPKVERDELLQYAQRVEQLLQNAVIMHPKDMFDCD
jgi:hypothetical protein